MNHISHPGLFEESGGLWALSPRKIIDRIKHLELSRDTWKAAAENIALDKFSGDARISQLEAERSALAAEFHQFRIGRNDGQRLLLERVRYLEKALSDIAEVEPGAECQVGCDQIASRALSFASSDSQGDGNG